MKLDILGLQAFVAIVSYGTFQKAAEFLHISQTALSRRLQGLETLIGLRLIDRTTHHWNLTVVGRNFLPTAQRLVNDLGNAFSDVRNVAKCGLGQVNVACVATMAFHFLADIVLRYSQRFPENRVRILESGSHAVMQAVLQRDAEFGVNVLTRHHPDIETTLLLKDPFVLICGKNHPLGRCRTIRWRDMEHQPIILLGRSSGNGLILEDVLHKLRLSLPWFYEVQHPSTALSLVAGGGGAAILPHLTLLRGAYPRIRMIPLINPTVQREIGLIRLRNSTLSPAAETLYKMVRDRMASRELSGRGHKNSGRHD